MGRERASGAAVWVKQQRRQQQQQEKEKEQGERGQVEQQQRQQQQQQQERDEEEREEEEEGMPLWPAVPRSGWSTGSLSSSASRHLASRRSFAMGVD